MIDELADIIDKVGCNSRQRMIVSFGQDRLDADVQGSAAIFDLILRKKYDAQSTCFYSKSIAFPMCRVISDTLPNCFARTEHTHDLAQLLERSPSVWVWDTANFSQMSGFDIVLGSQNFKEGRKRIYVIDHHKDNNAGRGTGCSPTDYGDRVRIYNYKTGANTSIVLMAMRRLGVTFHPHSADHQARAIAAYLAIQTDTQGFSDAYMTDIDQEATDYLKQVLTHDSMQLIETISTSVLFSWKLIDMRVKEYVNAGAFSATAVYAVGVVDDFGIIPHTADTLIQQGFKTSIVYGILVDGYGPWRSVTLNGSGRTCNNEAVGLPELFGKIFCEILPDGSHKALGGGRVSDDGTNAMCAGEIPLDDLRHMSQPIIEAHVWPAKATMYADRIKKIISGADKAVIEESSCPLQCRYKQ